MKFFSADQLTNFLCRKHCNIYSQWLHIIHTEQLHINETLYTSSDCNITLLMYPSHSILVHILNTNHSTATFNFTAANKSNAGNALLESLPNYIIRVSESLHQFFNHLLNSIRYFKVLNHFLFILGHWVPSQYIMCCIIPCTKICCKWSATTLVTPHCHTHFQEGQTFGQQHKILMSKESNNTGEYKIPSSLQMLQSIK